MAIEKEKVITRYKSLFGSVGLSQTRLDEISAKLALKMADDANDEDIDSRLNEMNDLYPFAEIKKNDDRALNDKNNPNRKSAETPKEEVKTETKTDDPVLALLQEMKGEIASLKAEKLHESLETKFRKDERLKGVPEFMLQMGAPKSEDEYEDKVNTLATNFKEFAEKAKIQEFGGDRTPNGTPPKQTGEVKQKTAEELKDLALSI